MSPRPSPEATLCGGDALSNRPASARESGSPNGFGDGNREFRRLKSVDRDNAPTNQTKQSHTQQFKSTECFSFNFAAVCERSAHTHTPTQPLKHSKCCRTHPKRGENTATTPPNVRATKRLTAADETKPKPTHSTPNSGPKLGRQQNHDTDHPLLTHLRAQGAADATETPPKTT